MNIIESFLSAKSNYKNKYKEFESEKQKLMERLRLDEHYRKYCYMEDEVSKYVSTFNLGNPVDLLEDNCISDIDLEVRYGDYKNNSIEIWNRNNPKEYSYAKISLDKIIMYKEYRDSYMSEDDGYDIECVVKFEVYEVKI